MSSSSGRKKSATVVQRDGVKASASKKRVTGAGDPNAIPSKPLSPRPKGDDAAGKKIEKSKSAASTTASKEKEKLSKEKSTAELPAVPPPPTTTTKDERDKAPTKKKEIRIVDEDGRPCKLHTAAAMGDLERVSELISEGSWTEKKDIDGATALHHASYRGHAKVVRYLLKAKADPNATDIDGTSPLHHACFRGHLEVVQVLKQGGANVNVSDKAGGTPLLNACFGGYQDIVTFLMSNEANSEVVDADGSTPLHYAAYNGQEEIVKLLLTKGTKPDSKDKDRATPLHHACFRGHLNVVKLLVQHGAKLNLADGEGGTPLHSAAFNKHTEIVKYLLENKVKVDEMDVEEATALHKSAFVGATDIVELLINAGANINRKDGMGATALHKAAFNGYSDTIELLMTKGAKVDITDNEGGTPLHNAVYNGQLLTASLLIKNKANANVVDNLGRTPLHGAACYGLFDICQLLLDKGCDPNAKDKDGYTPLHLAAFKGSVLTISFLLDRAANINVKNEVGVTPLHFAVFRGHLGAVTLLVEKNASTSIADSKGLTPLHHAALGGDLETVSYLLYKKAVIDHQENEGQTPLYLAVLSDQVEMALTLLERGADMNKEDNKGISPKKMASEHENEMMKLLFHIVENEPNPLPFSQKNKQRLNIKIGGIRDELNNIQKQLAVIGVKPLKMESAGGSNKKRKKGMMKKYGIDIDLNDPADMANSIFTEAKQINSQSSFLNILRHFLLIPNNEAIAVRIWKLLELFTHRAVILKDENDNTPDVVRMKLQDFLNQLKNKNKFDPSSKLYILSGIEEALAILFPGVTMGEDEGAGGEFKMEDSDDSDDEGEKKKKDVDGVKKEDESDEEAKKKEEEEFISFSSMAAPPPPPTGGMPDLPPPPPPPMGGGMGGAPPPPPMFGGGPPPPPGGMAIYTGPKLKRLNWTKIPKGKISASFFGSITLDTVLIDQSSLEKFFQVKEKKDKEVVLDSAPKQVNLLDLKYSNNVGILLSRIKVPLDGIKKAILELDETSLTVDDTRAILTAAPNEEAIEVLRTFKGDRSTLGRAETFCLKMMDVPRLSMRLETFLFKREFEPKMNDIKEDIKLVRKCVLQIRQSAKFTAILKFILVAGNILNQGNAAGNAQGYKLSSILKVHDTKSTNNKFSLLNYLAGLLNEKMPEVCNLKEDMPDVCDGCLERLNTVQSEMAGMKVNLRKINEEVKALSTNPSDTYVGVMSAFYKTANEQVEKLDQVMQETVNAFSELCDFYGEDKGVDCISIANQFVAQFEGAHKENMERKAKHEAEQEKKKKKKGKKAKLEKGTTSSTTPQPQASNLLGSHLDERMKKLKKKTGGGGVGEDANGHS